MHDATNSKPFVQSGESLSDFLRSFWRRQIDTAEQDTPDFRHPPLPLARIKKVMKSDPDVKMIAADAPILFCKACEIFIEEITARAFIVADANKRRTLSRADIAKALSKSDQFDFLIDIVPRDDPLPTAAGAIASSGSGAISNAANNANANAAAGSSASGSGSGSGAGLSMGAPVGMGGSGGGGGHHAGYAGGAGGNGKKLVEMRGHGHPHPHGHLEDDRRYSSGQLEGLDLMQGSNRPLANIALDESILDD